MHRALRLVTSVSISLLLFSPASFAADGAKLFADKGCVSCHGDKGQGVQGLAPPLKGNDWVKSASEADVANAYLKGRQGKNRRHTNIPGGMPPVAMSDDEGAALAKFVKGDLQK